MKLLIRNLARSTTETELRALFEAFGQIQSCNLVLDQKTDISKGFGFVEMFDRDQAMKAIEAMNGEELAGRELKVNEAKPKTKRPPRSPRSQESQGSQESQESQGSQESQTSFDDEPMRPNMFE